MANPIKLRSNKVLAILVCTLVSFCLIYSVSAQNTTVSATASNTQPDVGSTLTVTLAISNVQNLFGIDTTLQWNPSVLSLSNTALNLGDSQHNGVLYGIINRDYSSIAFVDIYFNKTKVSWSYELVAQSFCQVTPSYNGSATIATLTFYVVKPGPAGLSLQTDLADRALPGQNSNNIAHQDTASSVTAVASSNSPTSSTLASSTPTSSVTSTPSVPEFPATSIIALFIAVGIAVAAFASKKLSKKGIATSQSSSIIS